MFRHFPSKEDILFGDEDSSAEAMVHHVARRTDRSIGVAALAEGVGKFAAELQDERTHALTHLVTTNRSLEARSLRMRLRWERDIARQLAFEEGARPSLAHTLIASIAISCFSAALRYWDKDDPSTTLTDLVALAFAQPLSYRPTQPKSVGIGRGTRSELARHGARDRRTSHVTSAGHFPTEPVP